MALAHWNDSYRSSPRPGDAVFDTGLGWHHAMVVNSAGAVNPGGGMTVQIMHMAPPLLEETIEVGGSKETHWLGAFAELETERLESIHREALRLMQLVAPSPKKMMSYDFRLHDVEQSNPNGGGQITIRASCSSLLEHCYQVEGVDLVEETSVPQVASKAALAKLIDKTEKEVAIWTAQMQRKEEWPCQVLFPSYQMHAFSHPFVELPYKPKLSDHPYKAEAVTDREEGIDPDED